MCVGIGGGGGTLDPSIPVRKPILRTLSSQLAQCLSSLSGHAWTRRGLDFGSSRSAGVHDFGLHGNNSTRLTRSLLKGSYRGVRGLLQHTRPRFRRTPTPRGASAMKAPNVGGHPLNFRGSSYKRRQSRPETALPQRGVPYRQDWIPLRVQDAGASNLPASSAKRMELLQP